MTTGPDQAAMAPDSVAVKDRVRASVGDISDLVESIKKVGLLHPIVVDGGGRLVAGERRLEAARTLGWSSIPVTVVTSLDEALRAQAEGDENVCRQPFSPAEAVRYQERLTPFYAAEAAERKKAGKRPSAKVAEGPKTERETRAKAAKATGYSHTSLAKTKEVLKAAQDEMLPELVREKAQELAAGLEKPKANVNKAEKQLREALKEAQPVPEPMRSDGMTVLHCSLTELDLEPDSIDLIFTDPPYLQECLPLWSDLGSLAAKVLKPGGLLVSYSGQMFLPEVQSRLGEHLDYWWTYAVVHEHAFFQLRARRVNVGWKPLLVYRRPGPGGPPYVSDVVTDGKREKVWHDWQQAESEARYWVNGLTRPGDRVCDPFVGGGTTAVAARDLGRKFVGCDVDHTKVAATLERLR